MHLHIGIDDTDSPEGGCTTYIAARLVEQLSRLGVLFIDYPNLLRLNPNIPWKTRGNGAICLRLFVDDTQLLKVKDCVLKEVETYSEFDCDNTNPGVVFHVGKIPLLYKDFSKKVVSSVVNLHEAKKVIDKGGGEAVGFKNERGIIGAVSAIGGLHEGDYTFELLTYRKHTNYGTKRLLDEDSIWAMDFDSNETYNNVDYKSKRILITPNGPDPVLYGIRGETAKAVFQASRKVIPLEPVERWVIFRSNQGTDNHFLKIQKINELQPMSPVKVFASVKKTPWTILGGHVIFNIQDETGDIDCAAFEPTGNFRETIRILIPGDKIIAYGGITSGRNKPTINLEKIDLTSLAEEVQMKNPSCPMCKRSMESMGINKGYRCRYCGHRDGKLVKLCKKVDRGLETGLYFPQPGAQRHLSKPFIRYGKEKREEYLFPLLFNPWFGVGLL